MENLPSFEQIFKMWLLKIACHHKWEVHYEADIYKLGLPEPIEREEVLICQKCGKVVHHIW